MKIAATRLASLCLAFSAVIPAHAQLGGTLVSPPAVVNAGAGSDTGVDSDPCLVVGNNSVWMCLFTSTETTLTNGGDTDIFWMRSRDSGITWSAPSPLAPFFATDSGVTSTDIEPALASTGPSRMAVWASTHISPAGACGIYYAYSHTTSTTWINVLPVHHAFAIDAVEDRDPCIAGGANGTYVVVWVRTDTGSQRDLWFSRSTGIGGGGTWSTPARIDTDHPNDVGEDAQPSIATDGAGNWVVVFQSTANFFGAGSDSEIYCYESTDDGQTWSIPRMVNPTGHVDGGASDSEPSIAVDASTGTWLCAWSTRHTSGGDSEIVLSRRTAPTGSWGSVGQVNTDWQTDQATSTGDAQPFASSDQRGRFMVAWTRTMTNDSDTDLRAARSDNGGTSWTSPQLLDIDAHADSGADEKPQLVADGQGHWVGVWQTNDDPFLQSGPDKDVYAARFMTPGPDSLTRFCLGYTETGTPPRCPCGNDASPTSNTGCLNSTGIAGAVQALGSYEASSPSESILVNGVPPGAPVLFFDGTGQLSFGIGTALGDGRLCVAGSITRLGVIFTSGGGNGSLGFAPTGVGPGAVRFYQGWYRDSASFCTSATSNLTSAFATTWLP